MRGVVTGIVVDNRDPAGLHRVRVEYRVDAEDAPRSAWARVVTPFAGASRGWVALPELGDEVLLGFAAGSRHAYVLGALFNGVDLPPYANEDGGNHLRVFRSRSGHRLTFDDTPGSEAVRLQVTDESGAVEHELSGSGIQARVQGDAEHEAGQRVSFKCRSFSVQASSRVSVAAGSSLAAAASTGSLQAGGMLRIQAGRIDLNGPGSAASPASAPSFAGHRHPPAR